MTEARIVELARGPRSLREEVIALADGQRKERLEYMRQVILLLARQGRGRVPLAELLTDGIVRRDELLAYLHDEGLVVEVVGWWLWRREYLVLP